MANLNKKIFNVAKHDRKRKETNYSDIPTNYGELHPIVKINILDTIINQASAVFGPYGGIYGELKGADMMGGQEITEGGYEKSKDGHGFFNSLQLGSKYAQTIMKSIQQMTKYVAGYEGDTSRDGTTSVAIVGCNVAKSLLAYRLEKPEVPSTVQNVIFDLVQYVGTSLIEKYKVPIYDGENHKYIDDGLERAYNAIKTTVDGNRLFTEPFLKLMQSSVEEGYDLLDCHLASPNQVDAIANLELKVNAGIRFRASNLDTNQGGGFYNHQSYTFILDGYISPEHRDCYVYYLEEWLKHICSARDKEGLIFAPGRYDAPLIIVTRTPDYLEEVYQRLGREGITVTSNGAKHVIRPKFMIGNDNDSFKAYFDDMLSVFHESQINLNLMNRYIRDNKVTSDEIDPELGMVKHVGQKEVDLTRLFPRIADGGFHIMVPYSEESYDPSIKGDQVAKFVSLEPVQLNGANLMLLSNYDGQSLSLVPPTEELIARANAKRAELLELKKSLADTAMEDNMIPERLAFFSSCTIKPIISARSKDEYSQMFSLYEDALGVFQSVHKHGVMPGGNTFLLKHQDEFHNEFDKLVEEYLTAVKNEDKKTLYREFAKNVSSAVISGYIETLKILTRDDYETVAKGVSYDEEIQKDTLLSYDIVTGEWNKNVLEASRTTADVFASSVAMMKDMLQLKRIKLHVESGEHRQLVLSNDELNLSPMYKQYEVNVDDER